MGPIQLMLFGAGFFLSFATYNMSILYYIGVVERLKHTYDSNPYKADPRPRNARGELL